jgi:hypothetical protein
VACDWPADECLHDHIRPHLRDPREAGRSSYRALAPCHSDTAHSLSVSVLDERVVWNCFTCKKRLGNDVAQVATRNALIRDRVPARCLPQPASDAERQLEAVRQILGTKGKPAMRLLRIAAVLEGWGALPQGDELADLAASCLISRRTAFEARREGLDR